MPVISKITVQKKNKERYNIYIEDVYSFSVDEAVLINFQLRKGTEVTKELLEQVMEEDSIRKGYGLAINFLSYRMRSIKEVSDYLIKKDLELETVQIILKKLIDENYLNDQEFAQAFVQSRVNLSLKGPEIIKRELLEKGVGEVDINNSLRHFSHEQQLEKALSFLMKKYPRTLKTSRAEQDKKIYLLLFSKGFSHEVVQQAFTEFYKEQEEDNSEWEAIKAQGAKALKKYQAFSDWERKQKMKQFLYRKGFSFEMIDKVLEYIENEGE
ncbi:recombination regulator RecX [Anaerobacillus alkaliphilus]|uniref:Regulatory protein RecX n=1 Tax=Anaerobacillus alkaliphilus TaxID=1548597 RepID=A0A4V1LGD6_9BACI|nr:recombination regulator RecX [Anaerobacillus alkaliphilus]RXJ00392.1 recombination regulator RecX [Anaerobacillus alkaliphilus]